MARRHLVALCGGVTLGRQMAEVRRPTTDDRDRLAELMLDAYVGTIDYDGETMVEAVAEIDGYFAAKAGVPVLAHSLVAVEAGRIVSAALLSNLKGLPHVAYLYTDPARKRRGLAQGLLRSAMTSLAAAGHERIYLWVTPGNTPAERIYERLGFVDVPPENVPAA
jgi:ribosomal protein S18 acetylase RimI-like enzyme